VADRKCWLCQKPPREGETMHLVRLREEDDLVNDEVRLGVMYQACSDCTEKHRERMANRMGKEVREISFGMMT
jgi:hypothetical protein